MAAATVAPKEIVLRWKNVHGGSKFTITCKTEIPWTAFLESVSNALRGRDTNTFIPMVGQLTIVTDEAAPEMTISEIAEKYGWDESGFPEILIYYAEDASTKYHIARAKPVQTQYVERLRHKLDYASLYSSESREGVTRAEAKVAKAATGLERAKRTMDSAGVTRAEAEVAQAAKELQTANERSTMYFDAYDKMYRRLIAAERR